jgi:hypothetical protein
MRILTDIRKYNPNVLFLLENVEMGEKWEKVLTKAIGIEGLHINSALVSAQNRKRIYWTNIGIEQRGLFDEFYLGIPQPKDKGILLKDILESIKLEDWEVNIDNERNYSLGSRRTYMVELYNPSKTLKIRSRLYAYEGKANLASFTVIRTVGNTVFTAGSVSYDCDNTETSTLILSQLWGYILKHHEDIYSETLSGYKVVKESIDTELKTVKRDKALKSLLG